MSDAKKEMERAVLKKRFKLTKQIGCGAFGMVYECIDIVSGRKYACKLEVRQSNKCSVLGIELGILRKLRYHSDCVAGYVCCGTTQHHHYVVMKLLGADLATQRRKAPGKRFTLGTVLRLGVAMSRCIRVLHEAGFIHRDVKPSNFVLGRHNSNKLYVIDFGISRKYVDGSGKPLPARENAGFRGTARYASVAAHRRQDLAPRDDYWSLLFVLVDLAHGSLPWSSVRDRDKIGELKAQAVESGALVDGCPPSLGRLMAYLHTVAFTDPIDHDLVRSMFIDDLAEQGLPPDGDYDWSVNPTTTPTQLSPGHTPSASRATLNSDVLSVSASAAMSRQTSQVLLTQSESGTRLSISGSSDRNSFSEPQTPSLLRKSFSAAMPPVAEDLGGDASNLRKEHGSSMEKKSAHSRSATLNLPSTSTTVPQSPGRPPRSPLPSTSATKRSTRTPTHTPPGVTHTVDPVPVEVNVNVNVGRGEGVTGWLLGMMSCFSACRHPSY